MVFGTSGPYCMCALETHVVHKSDVWWHHFCVVMMYPIDFSFVTDASTYAHYLFNAFDSTKNGSIKFEVHHILSQRGLILAPT